MRPTTTVNKLALWLSWAIAVILALLPVHAVFTTWLGSNFGHLDLIRIWKEILIIILLGPTFWLGWQRPKLKHWLLRSWIVRLFLIYILLHGVLGAWALHNHQVNRTALIYSLLINLRFIGFFIVCYIATGSSDFLDKHWRRVLILPSLAVIIFGLLQRFILPYDFLKHLGYGPKTIPAYQTIDASLDFRRIQSTLRGANPLGAYLVLIIPALLVAFKKHRAVQILNIAAALVILFFSYSRSAWIGLALAGSLLAWWGLSVKDRRWLLVSIAVSTLVLGGSIYTLRFNNSLEDTLFHTSSQSRSARSSNDVRLASLKNGVSDVWYQPSGRGPGTAGPASLRNGHPSRIAENYYIQIAQEVGIIGLLIFLAINGLVAYQLWLIRREDLAKILLASLVGITFINLVSHAWTDDTLSLLWWGLAGIALAPAVRPTANRKNT